MRIEFVCRVCDKPVIREGVRGNERQKRKLCDHCMQWHKWCFWGDHGPLKSQFFGYASRTDGVSSYSHCKTCMPYTRGRRILQCQHCRADYLPAVKSNRHNGKGVPLCDDCYGYVKHCNRCDRTLPVERFSRTSDKACGRSAFCKACNQVTWKETSTEVKFLHRARSKKFDITHDEYLAKRQEQSNLCAICGSPETDSIRGQVINLAIDHCHTTNQVRGLLCGRCNKAIGLMLDDPVRLRAAADYLEKWAAALAV